MPLSAQTLDSTFKLLAETAARGERCPMQAREGHPGLPRDATTILARDGKIRIEVYARNWRVVEILTGPHQGKRTQEPPWGGKPYLVIETKEPQQGEAA